MSPWSETAIERFFAHTTEGPTVRPELGPCLDSTYYVHSSNGNRPNIVIAGKRVLAARFALAHSLGRPIASGKQALHHCDRPMCVRAEHLYEGTPKDNMRDRDARTGNPMKRPAVRAKMAASRAETMFERGQWVRLNDEAVRVIRFLVDRRVSQVRLARAHGVGIETICDIVHWRTWDHVDVDQCA